MSTSQWSSTNSLTTKASYVPSSEEALLASINPQPQGSYQGYNIAITPDKTRVIVGAPYASNNGYVFIFYKSGSNWIKEYILSNSDHGGKMFGASVDINSTGDKVIVGAPTATYYYNGEYYNTVGCAYIYYRSGSSWYQEYIFQPHYYNQYGDKAGYSVSISDNGNIVAMSVPYNNYGVADSGSVYIYTKTSGNWPNDPVKIYGSDTSNSRFGSSISMTGDGMRLVVGEDYNSQNGFTTAGKAYIFKNNSGSWIQEAVLIPLDRVNGDYFGCSVDITDDGTRVIVGASQGGSSYQKGKVYIFTRSGTTWSQEAKLVANDGNYEDKFGYSVSINNAGDRVVIGAPYSEVNPYSNVGKAYIFTRSGTTWIQQAILIPSARNTDDHFGWSVTISDDGNKILVGAPMSDASSYTDGGGVFIFS
jgi:hypothetical protein